LFAQSVHRFGGTLVTWRILFRAFLVAALVVVAPATPIQSQVAAGATLTVTRGTASVVKTDGSTVAPASSGLALGAGDQVATQPLSKALVTFFDGSEIELDPETTLILREITSAGSKTSIAVETVVGATVHRVTTFLDPGSSYRVLSGGSVALVRGTVFTHAAQPTGEVTVSLQQCGRLPGAPANNACLEFPQPGRRMQTGETCTFSQQNGVTTLRCQRQQSSRQSRRSSSSSHSP
jgi:hypothetical protein